MKIVAGSDWRDGIPFETPMIVAELAPGDDARCALCPADAPSHPRTELWAVKHRHPKNHSGYVRFYCGEHRPAPPVAPAPLLGARATREARSAISRERGERIPKRSAPAVEITRAMCPNCFLEVSASGECGVCGERVG